MGQRTNDLQEGGNAMNAKDNVDIGVRASWHFEQVRDGRIIAVRDVPNLVVNVGLDRLCSMSFQTSTVQDKYGWTAVGTDAAAPAVGNTALGTESNRVANVYTKGATGVCNMSSSHTGLTITASEAGLFSTNSAGFMFNRATYSPATLTSGDTLNVVVTVSFT